MRTSTTARGAAVIATLAWVVAVAPPASAQLSTNPELVSVATDGSQGNGGSWLAAISADGRFVAFQSVATNFGASQLGNKVFLRDLSTGSTELVSGNVTHPLIGDDSLLGGQANGYRMAISGNGRYVAFSTFTSYDMFDLNLANDAYIYDRVSNTYTWATRGQGLGGCCPREEFSLSHDGRYMTFYSDSAAMVAGDVNDAPDVFRFDRVTKETVLVSVTSDEQQANGWSDGHAISGNGRYVAFQSDATNLVPNDLNGRYDVFVRDMAAGTTTRVSLGANGSERYGSDNHSPTISGSGDRVVFADDGGVHLWDRSQGTTSVISNDRPAAFTTPQISEDGSTVVWVEVHGAVRKHHVASGAASYASLSHTGTIVSGTINDPSLSADGRYMTFSSSNIDVVPFDSNGQTDVFVRDLTAPPSSGNPDYVAFGDSLTTGFSVPDCDGDRVASPHGCSGSPTVDPYPNLVYLRSQPNYTSLARVGIWGYTVQEAREDHDAGWNEQGGWKPQLKWIDRADQLVTGALGINDMQWSDVAAWTEACLTIGCQTRASALVAARDADFDLMFDKLSAAQARGVDVVVTLYYNPIENHPDCDSSYSVSETIVDTLNDELRDRALAAAPDITTADLHTRFLGHGVGSADPWVFGDTCDDNSAIIASLLPDWLSPENDADVPINRDPHPNAEGVSEMADAILEVL